MTQVWYFWCFLILRSSESFTDNILSYEAIDPYFKKYTFSDREIQFNWDFCHVLLTNKHSITYNQNDRFAFFIWDIN